MPFLLYYTSLCGLPTLTGRLEPKPNRTMLTPGLLSHSVIIRPLDRSWRWRGRKCPLDTSKENPSKLKEIPRLEYTINRELENIIRQGTYLIKWASPLIPLHKKRGIHDNDFQYPSARKLRFSQYSSQHWGVLTPDHTPLNQLCCLYPLRSSELKCRTPTIFALESELVFRGQLGHVWGPLALRLVRTVIGHGFAVGVFFGRWRVVILGGGSVVVRG